MKSFFGLAFALAAAGLHRGCASAKRNGDRQRSDDELHAAADRTRGPRLRSASRHLRTTRRDRRLFQRTDQRDRARPHRLADDRFDAGDGRRPALDARRRTVHRRRDDVRAVAIHFAVVGGVGQLERSDEHGDDRRWRRRRIRARTAACAATAATRTSAVSRLDLADRDDLHCVSDDSFRVRPAR